MTRKQWSNWAGVGSRENYGEDKQRFMIGLVWVMVLIQEWCGTAKQNRKHGFSKRKDLEDAWDAEKEKRAKWRDA